MVERLEGQLTPDTALLKTSEGRTKGEYVVLVDPDVASFEALRGPMSFVQTSRPDASAEAKRDVIGLRDHRLIIVPGDDAEHRAEDLLLSNAHLVVDIG